MLYAKLHNQWYPTVFIVCALRQRVTWPPCISRPIYALVPQEGSIGKFVHGLFSRQIVLPLQCEIAHVNGTTIVYRMCSAPTLK